MAEEKTDKKPKRNVDWLIENIDRVNIAEILGDDELVDIGHRVHEDYTVDKDSRAEWEQTMEKATKLARQVGEGRTYAGEKISDVMYPIIATAAIQYSSRAMSAIMKPGEVVKCKVVGRDDDGAKAARGERVATHMNYQILEQMDGWRADMDKLLASHSILGSYYKKVYYDPIDRKNKSEIVSPLDFVVNYWAKSLYKAPQRTHIIEKTHNEYLEYVNSDTWVGIDIEPPDDRDKKIHTFLEQDRCYDLDGDGYGEPYIVTIHEETRKVVRIVANYKATGITINEADGNVVRIRTERFYTKYGFMPSFDGSFYDTGFGSLLSPINSSVNTIINQLLDAGTAANRPSGFIGRGVRLLRGGESGTVRLRPGEWLPVQNIGNDLRQNIFQVPASNPSPVLFQLLGLMLEASKELSSRSDLLSGNQQQHNVPATTTLALIEQGLQVYGSIHERVVDGLKSELKLIFELNKDILEERDYIAVVDDEKASLDDYRNEGFDIIPVTTSSTITSTQKYAKAQALRELYGVPVLNGQEIMRRYLTALEEPDIEKLLQLPEPGPNFDQQIEFKKLFLKEMELRLKSHELELKEGLEHHKKREIDSKVVKNLADAESKEIGAQMDMYRREADRMMDDVRKIDEQLALMREMKKQKEAQEKAKAAAGEQVQNEARGQVNNAPGGGVQ